MQIRGIRGATTARQNAKEDIIEATKELLLEVVKRNQLNVDDIASIIFTTTLDLNAEFPAAAARELGWRETALLCTHEINVPESLSHCIRVLLHINSEKKQSEIQHVYLHGAVNLRR